MTRPQWEYHIETREETAHEYHPTFLEQWRLRLNELGADGWELVFERHKAENQRWYYAATFKRPNT